MGAGAVVGPKCPRLQISYTQLLATLLWARHRVYLAQRGSIGIMNVACTRYVPGTKYSHRIMNVYSYVVLLKHVELRVTRQAVHVVLAAPPAHFLLVVFSATTTTWRGRRGADTDSVIVHCMLLYNC